MILTVGCQKKNGTKSLKAKAWKIMKLTIALLLFFTFQVSAKGYGQKITIHKKNAPLSEVFKAIEKQTNFLFFYDKDLIQKAERIDITLKNASIDDVMSACLKDQQLSYSIVNSTIVIQAKKSFFPPVRSIAMNIPADPPPPVEIHGTVLKPDGEPIQNVSVLVAGTKIGTTTDNKGYFSLTVADNRNIVLEISSIGFETKRVKVGKQTELNITLEETQTGLNEVVVVGYGTRAKKDLTGSVAQVKTKELESVPVYSLEEALKGRASGVQVVHNSGAPGSRIEVRIRGANSMIGDNTPLYVVDGFPVTGGIDFLNPSDIESIDILKDASATAIYGSRGANGVVIITSKRGKGRDRSTVTVDAFYGTQRVAKKYDLLNAKQYATVANEFLKNDGLAPFFDVNQVNDPGTDWQDVIFRDAPLQNHTLTFSGSTEKTNYSLSGNYYNQEGIIMNSSAQRGSFRFNLDHDVKSWLTLSANVALSRRETFSAPVDNGERGNTMFSGALSAPPTLKPYDSSGQYTRIEQIYPFTDPTDIRNPLIWGKPRRDRRLSNSVLLNNSLNVKFTKELSFKTRVGVEYENASTDFFSPIIFQNDRGSASSGSSYWNSFLNENTINYSKSFNKSQKLDLVAGLTYQKYSTKYTNISVSGFSNNITENYNLGAAETINPPSSGISEWTLASWLGRVNYSLLNKYFITASARADGSSRFGSDNKWGVFPSAAIAWRVSDESFMQSMKLISNLKFRASYGVTGNTGLSPYQSLNRLSPVNYIFSGNTASIGYVPSGLSNSQLRWETTNELDFGFDLSILSNRINFTFDYYKKNTDNLLASVPLPPSVGFGSVLQNIGEVQNQGIELSVSTDILVDAFKWNLSAQLSTNRNKVISLAGGSDIISSGSLTGLAGVNIARVGEPLGEFYGYIEDGLDDVGFIKYKDLNNDGIINALDRTIIGNPYPKFTYGFNSNFSYKGVDLNFFIQGSQGNDIFWRTAYTNLNSFQRSQNQLADLFNNYWTADKPDPNAKYPKISKSTQMQGSDRFIKDGSYIRLKSLQLGYSIDASRTGKTWFTRARIYVSATNLFTITDYPGLDPEINTTGNDSQSIGNRLQIGIDASGYPNARTFGAGIQFSF